ncbi:MAG: rhomboid family intramembrane serine protease [Candidatus Neomarinimicrobiota bacterium]|nr:MAG: rhomboid family intramembrane serine protease [Candidatus Neomarinimicrobiota bacterium]
MNYYRYGNDLRFGRGNIRPRLFKGAIRNIIIINVAVFIFMYLFPVERFFILTFGLVPKLVWSRGFIWQPLTHLFIHGGFWHIFWNMFVLWMFGMEIENYWGKKEFYKYYFITGIGSGLITLLFSLNSTIPVVGASGAIFGILIAFALMFPNRYLYLYFLIPIKAKYFVIFVAVITFFSTFTPGASHISHLTHLGGFLIGFVYLKRWQISSFIRSKFPHTGLFWTKIRFKIPIRKVHKTSKDEELIKKYDTDETFKEELNRVLDKINKYGYDTLDEEEKRTLYLASAYFADKENKKD